MPVSVRDLVEDARARACALLHRPLPPLRFDPTLRNANSDGVSVGVNPGWMRAALVTAGCSDRACRDAVLGIVAHELGHHYDPDRSPDRWTRERFADAVAGVVLERAGASTEPMFRVLATLPFSPHHPPPDERRGFVALGRAYARVVGHPSPSSPGHVEAAR